MPESLGMASNLIPGPGIRVFVYLATNWRKNRIVRESDAILREEIRN